MAVDFDKMRAALEGIDWGEGLTRDGIRVRWPGLPQEVYLHLPSEKEFHSAEELVRFSQLRLAMSERPEPFDEVEVATEGGPTAWGESPTAITTGLPEETSGVGSGGDPGYTGGGSTQTGVGREGTTYGDGTEVVDEDELA